jgi:hypothetical protein
MRRADAPRASSAGEEGGARCRRGDDRRGGCTRWDEVTPRRMDRVDDGRGSILSSVSNTLDVISLSLSLSLGRGRLLYFSRVCTGSSGGRWLGELRPSFRLGEIMGLGAGLLFMPRRR